MKPITEPVLPFWAHRALSGLTEPMRMYAMNHVEEFIQTTGAEVVTMEEVKAAISYGLTELEKDQAMQPDLEFMSRSMAAYEAGEWQDIDGVINELQGAGA